jgi:phage regulator Rha-like protein
MTEKKQSLIESESIEAKIYSIRGYRVMLDSDLAEQENLKSQFATSSLKDQINKENHGGRRKPISAFTEHGLLMLANVLRSKQAIAVSIQIIEAFVRLRQLGPVNTEIAANIKELEKTVKTNSSDIKLIFNTINTMLNPRTDKKPKIGFKPDK